MINLPNRIESNGYLTSPLEGQWTPNAVAGSLFRTLKKAILQNCLEKPDHDWNLFNDAVQNQSISAKESLRLAESYAKVFKYLGIQVGEVVHIFVGNDLLTYPLSFATWIIGGIASLGYVNIEPKITALQLMTVKAKVIVFTKKYVKEVEEILETLETNDYGIIALSLDDTKIITSSSFMSDLLKKTVNDPPIEAYETVEPHKDPAIIFWSSGTTGVPKALLHSHSSTFNCSGMDLCKFVTSLGPAVVTSLNFQHRAGYCTAFRAILNGLPIHYVCLDDLNLDYLLQTIRLTRPTRIRLASYHYVALAKRAKIRASEDSHGLSSVETITPIGTNVPAFCEFHLRSMFPNLKGIYRTYGLGETGVTTAGLSLKSLGTILPGITYKIIDPDGGAVLGPGFQGEICIKTNHGFMLKCIVPAGNDSGEIIDPEGFVRTGDLGFFDKTGFIYYVDRIKELIKVEHCHVSPSELEHILETHPAVRECLVFGKPTDDDQEIISAVIVPRAGVKVSDDKSSQSCINQVEKTTEQELLDYVNNQVADFKKIKGGILFRNEIPRNVLGKLLRRQLREWARNHSSTL